MKATRSVLVGILLAGCASSGGHGGGSSEWKIGGSPPVVVHLPARVTESDLVDGIPPIRIDGRADIQAALVLFEDRDGNAQISEGEHTFRFRALPDASGLVVAGVRLSRMQVDSLGRDKWLAVEVLMPGKDKPDVFNRRIE
jgi:hypothetical protein